MSACQGATISLHSLWLFPLARTRSARCSAPSTAARVPSAEREADMYQSIQSQRVIIHTLPAMCGVCTQSTDSHKYTHLHYNAHGPQHTITYNNITISCPESTWCTRRERWIVHASWAWATRIAHGSGRAHRGITPRTSRVWRPCGGVELCGRRAGGSCSAERLGQGLVRGHRGEWPRTRASTALPLWPRPASRRSSSSKSQPTDSSS